MLNLCTCRQEGEQMNSNSRNAIYNRVGETYVLSVLAAKEFYLDGVLFYVRGAVDIGQGMHISLN